MTRRTTNAVDAIVKAVLYEGYALYPYRPSALKNQRRFAFGAVYPKAWATVAREPYLMRSECVIERTGDAASVEIAVRFLVLHRGGGASEETIAMSPCPLEPGAWRHYTARAGIQIEIQIDIVDAGDGLHRVAIEIENVTAAAASLDREAAMDLTMASTHTVVKAVGGTAVSSIDPPAHAAQVVAACRTVGAYCILVARDTILCSPIVLSDYPEIAADSPGDFFDGTEMDEMLTLRVLTMTDAEKAEAIASDPRIAELVERTTALGIERTARLHGVATRADGRVPGAPREAMLLPGTRVRLAPTGRADAFDIVLAGKLATIAKVERDLDGRLHCSVTVDDDPGKDLGEAGMPGHRFYFRPEELEILPAEDAT